MGITLRNSTASENTPGGGGSSDEETIDFLAAAMKIDSEDVWTHQRLKMLMGTLKTDGKGLKGERSKYNMEKWKFMLNSPFLIGDGCCRVMKKKPAKMYKKQTGRLPIIGTMASESLIRTQQWVQKGCNEFNGDKASSKPMSFWLEEDVLAYCLTNNIEICSVYGDIVAEDGSEIDREGLMDTGVFDRPALTTTKLSRTGCMFCGYGCHLEKDPGRFVQMKKTHPKQYDYIMRPKEEGGMNYKELIDWINENGNLDIKY